MDKRKPAVVSSRIEDHKAVLSLHVDEDIADFNGHFEGFPILPGVTQIDWAVYFATACLGVSGAFGGMEVIKFQQPILPDADVELELGWDEAREKLSFRYYSAGGAVHSSGRILLSPVKDNVTNLNQSDD